MDRGPGARKQARLQRKADRIAFLIVATDYPAVDIRIEVEALRRECEELFPGREALFDMIYDARFRRLFSQFRSTEETL